MASRGGKTVSPADDKRPATFGRLYGALARLGGGKGPAASRRTVFGLVEEISAQLHDFASERAGEIAVHPTTVQVLILLARGSRDGVLKAAELQRALGFTHGGVTRRLDSMVAMDLVERLPDPADGRAWLVSLTDRGRALAAKALAGTSTRNARTEAAFSDAEWTILAALLRRLADTLAESPE